MPSTLYLDLHHSHRPPRRKRTCRQLWLLYAYAHVRFFLTRSEFWLRLVVRAEMHLRGEPELGPADYRRICDRTIDATKRRHQCCEPGTTRRQ